MWHPAGSTWLGSLHWQKLIFQQFKSHIFFQKSNFNFNLCPLFSSSPGAVKSPNPKRDIPLDRLDLAASIERGQPWQRPLGISCLCRRTLWSSDQSSVPKAEAAWGRHGSGGGCKGCTGRGRLTLRSGFVKDALISHFTEISRLVKVSWFRNVFFVSSILPKNERKYSTLLLKYLKLSLFCGSQKDISKLTDL